MNQLNIRTTFDDNGVADSHEIKFNKYRLLAYKYNKYGSQIEAWDKISTEETSALAARRKQAKGMQDEFKSAYKAHDYIENSKKIGKSTIFISN